MHLYLACRLAYQVCGGVLIPAARHAIRSRLNRWRWAAWALAAARYVASGSAVAESHAS